MTQQGKAFKERYYRYIANLKLYRSVLHSVNFQSERVAEVESVQTTILSEP